MTTNLSNRHSGEDGIHLKTFDSCVIKFSMTEPCSAANAGPMRFAPLILMLAAAAAWAQQDSPMVVIGGGNQQKRPASEIEQERLINQFPEWAITRAGAATGGYDKDVPPTPNYPTSPQPAARTEPPVPQTPAAPASPTPPASKLWPADTVPIFLRSCVGYQPKLIIPCKCVIGRLMVEIPHDEFLLLTAKGTIEQDQRLRIIRSQCAANSATGQP